MRPRQSLPSGLPRGLARMRCSRPSVCTTEYLEEDLTSEAARNGILSAMLERCYERSERDLARLRMALERAAQLEEENRNLRRRTH